MYIPSIRIWVSQIHILLPSPQDYPLSTLSTRTAIFLSNSSFSFSLAVIPSAPSTCGVVHSPTEAQATRPIPKSARVRGVRERYDLYPEYF